MHGNLADAFRAHPLGPLLYLAFALSALLTLVALFRKQKFEFGHPWVVRSTTALVIALFVFGAIRFATTTATLNAEMPIWAQK